jgi:MFS family permease
VLLALFLLIEARLAAEPLVPLGVFRNRTSRREPRDAARRPRAVRRVLLPVPLHAAGPRLLALRAGVSYLPLTAVIIVSSGLASFLMGRVGVKPLMIIGLIVASTGLYLFSRISVEGDYATEILPAMLIMAAGMGFVFVPGTTAAVAGVEPAIAGLASALVNTAQQIGGALGLAILTYVATTRTQDVMAGAGQPSPEALVEGFQRAFLYSGSFVLAGVAFAILMIRGGIEAPKPGEPVAAYGD